MSINMVINNLFHISVEYKNAWRSDGFKNNLINLFYKGWT